MFVFGCQGDMVLANNKAVLMSPLQLHCVNKRMTLPLGSSGQWVGLEVRGCGQWVELGGVVTWLGSSFGQNPCGAM